MEIVDKIDKSLTDALKNKDQDRTLTLRSIISQKKQKEIEKRPQDNKNITDEPLNKYCENLGINCFNLFVDKNVVKNLNLNFEKNKLHVKSYFDAGIASSLAFLSDQEKKDGVLNIDIGAKTSKIVAYIDKKIVLHPLTK